MTVGDRIRQRREELNLTQSELGEVIDSNKCLIFKYEQDIVKNIPISKLEKIAKKLNVSPSYLLGWEKDINRI